MGDNYDITRLPIDAVKSVAKIGAWPIHFGKTIATNVTDTAFKVIGTNTEDKPSKTPLKDDSIYEMAESNLDIAAIIYYYTELRSETRRLLKKYTVEKGMTWEASNPEEPSQLVILRNAVKLVEKRSKTIQSPETTASVHVLKDYQDSVMQLEGLRKKFNLDEGDLDIFKTYFDILSEPKTLSDVKSDTILFDNYISPAFRVSFGGTKYNRRKIENLIGDDKEAYIHEIDDDFNATSLRPLGIIKGFTSEIVWAIVVCDKKKTITVVFRGSVNASDWIKNLQCNMTNCKLPGFTSENAKGGDVYGQVHEGFYKYLFEKTKVGMNGSSKSKGEEIMGKLKGDFFSKPRFSDYSLYVTGHSLGGALSTLFAFRAATEKNFNVPITNVSFASPFVGNDEFREKFVDLERLKKIRHLRISNYQDLVTLIPATTFPLPNGIQTFKHTGMNIRLYEGRDLLAPSYRRFYPKMGSITNGLRNAMHANIPLGLSVSPISNHLCPEYTKRLTNEKTKEELSKLSLDELYGDKSITGWDYIKN